MGTKNLLLCLCVVSAFCAGAQKNYLTKIYSPFSEYTYTFGSHDKVVAATSDDTYTVQYKYSYDDNNQLIREDDYQLMDDGNYKLACYLLYTYDEHGNLASRENYNSDVWGGTDQYIKSGLITYAYDENHNMTDELTGMFFGGDDFVALCKKSYEFDADNKPTKMTYYDNMDFWGEEDEPVWEESMRGAYEYNEAGKLMVDSVYEYDMYGTGEWVKSVKNVYDYDDHGNVILHECYRGSGDKWGLVSFEEYEYDTAVSAADYIYPRTHESHWPVFDDIVNERTVEHSHLLDADGVMQLFDSYTYEYTDTGDVSAVSEVVADKKLSLYPNPVEDSFGVSGVDANQAVYVFDKDGRLKVVFSNSHAPMNVSELAAGIYIVKCGKYSVKMIKK